MESDVQYGLGIADCLERGAAYHELQHVKRGIVGLANAFKAAKDAYNNGWYTCPDEPAWQEQPNDQGCGKCLECVLEANS